MSNQGRILRGEKWNDKLVFEKQYGTKKAVDWINSQTTIAEDMAFYLESLNEKETETKSESKSKGKK